MGDRIEMLLTTVDLSSSKGLELGPLTNPVVRRDQGDIRYLDHVDTETLRCGRPPCWPTWSMPI